MPGAERLRDDPTLQRLLHRQADSKRLVTAMCASDIVENFVCIESWFHKAV
jgi:putative intracellular protease/amidase